MSTLNPGLDLHRQVRAAFVAQGTSLRAWSHANGIRPSNVRDALIGRWNGPKGIALRQRVVKAAGVKASAHA